MANVDLNRCYPKEAHLAAFEAAHNLHLAVLTWMKQSIAPRSLVTLLERRTLRAAEALFYARRSRSYERLLRRAQEDLWMCLARFTMLTDAGHFSRELCYEAQSRINQILVGIDQLNDTPMEKWLDLELPPRISMGDSRTAAMERGALDNKISAAANIPRFFPPKLKPTLVKKRAPDESPPKKPTDGDAKSSSA